MKKFLPIFLAFLMLATSSPTGQGISTVMKLGGFVHHFIHHITCHGDKIGLGDFVALHYSDHGHHEEDHQEHGNLPFSHDHDQQGIATHGFWLVSQQYETLAFCKRDIFSNPLIFHSQQFHSSAYSGDIWQPPRA
jgi:hypothetical protein